MAVIPDMRGMGEIWGVKGDRGRGGENLLTERALLMMGSNSQEGQRACSPCAEGGPLNFPC